MTDTRTTLMAVLATLWSVRLTYNFYRRGGYDGWPYNIFGGEEDYRWEILRRGTLGGWWALLKNKYVWVVFNVVFVSFYQNWLLLYIATPSLVAWSMAMKQRHCNDDDGDLQSSSLNVIDGIATVIFLFALVIESMADNQQLKFQTKKHAVKSGSDRTSPDTNEDIVNGFCQSGLFAIVRKPNYAAEQLMWITYYFFSVAASESHGNYQWVNWSLGGFILLCLLFQGSGWLTEQISISKYAAYKDYQRRVPLYVPKITTLWNLLAGKSTEKVDKTH